MLLLALGLLAIYAPPEWFIGTRRQVYDKLNRPRSLAVWRHEACSDLSEMANIAEGAGEDEYGSVFHDYYAATS